MEILRREGERLHSGSSFEEILPGFLPGQERWVFVSPHDDDIVIGAGILLQQALREKVKIKVLVTTDGSLGYMTAEQEKTIKDIRRKETIESFRLLGVDDVEWLGFPDASLTLYQGRHPAKPGEPGAIAGYGGIENSYAWHLRRAKATRIFVPSGADYHLDHKVVYQELLMSVYHSVGGIWPELGEPSPVFPRVTEMAIYCDFPQVPNLALRAPAEFLEKKLAAIEAYASQKTIIRALVDNLRRQGPVEYFRDTEFTLYEPAKYAALFTR